MTTNILLYSLDTVRVHIPFRADLYDALSHAGLFARRHPDFNLLEALGGEPYSVRDFFYLMPEYKMDTLPSNWTPPQVSISQNSREPETDLELPELVFQVSIPKMSFGHSARHAGDLQLFLDTLYSLLGSYGIEPLPWSTWRVSRIDISYNFNMGNLAAVDQAEKQLSRLRFYGKMGILKRNGRSHQATWPGQQRTVKFYGKYREMLYRKDDYPKDFIVDHSFQLQPILRFEEEWRSRFIARQMGLKSVYDLTADKLVAFFEKKYDQVDHISKIQKAFCKSGPLVDIEEMFQKIDGRRKSKTLRKFAMMILNRGIDIAKTEYPKRTFYDNCRFLRSMNIDPYSIENVFYETNQDSLPLLDYLHVGNYSNLMDEVQIAQNPIFEDFQAIELGCVPLKPKNDFDFEQYDIDYGY